MSVRAGLGAWRDRARSTVLPTQASALVATLLWGTQGPAAKFLVAEAALPLLAVLRGVSAAAVLTAVVGWHQGWRALALPRPDAVRVIALGVVGLGICQVAWLYALTRIPASAAVILTNTAPLYIAVMAVVWLGERLRRTTVIGLGLSFAGVLALVLQGSGTAGVLDLPGVLAALVSGFTWAVYTVLGRDLVRRYDPMRMVALSALVGALCLVPLALVVQPLGALVQRPHVLLGGVYLGVVPVAIGYVLWYSALRRLRAVQTAVFQYMIPVWTVALAHVWLGEPMTPGLLGGMALVIAGVWIVQRH